MTSSSLPHLQAHHRDFAAFRDVMIDTSASRFGPLWWGVWDQLVTPPAGATVVDLGTGPGMLLPHLRARGYRAIGVEVQPRMLEHARTLAASCGAEIVEADLATLPLPLPDGVADVVTAVHLFHELEFPPPLLAEAHRLLRPPGADAGGLLRPGGVLVLYDWVKRPLADYLEGKEPDADTLQHFREHCLFSPEDLEFLVTRAGFRVRETVGRKGGHYAMIVAERA